MAPITRSQTGSLPALRRLSLSLGATKVQKRCNGKGPKSKSQVRKLISHLRYWSSVLLPAHNTPTSTTPIPPFLSWWQLHDYQNHQWFDDALVLDSGYSVGLPKGTTEPFPAFVDYTPEVVDLTCGGPSREGRKVEDHCVTCCEERIYWMQMEWLGGVCATREECGW